MMYLKQSTSVDVPVGPFVDATDGVTPETGLTITQPDVRLKKNGGAWAQKAAAQTLTHEENGWYEVTLDTTDTDTIGHLVVAIYESGALPVWREFHVLAANVYDSLFGAATDKLDVNVEEWNTTAVPAEHTAGYPIVTIKDGTGTGEINTNAGAIVSVTTTDTATAVTTVNGLAANTVTASALAADAVTEIQSGLSTLDAAGVRTAVGLASANLDTQLAAIDDYIDAEIAAIKAKTDQLTFTTANRVDSQVYGMEAGTVTAAAVATGAIDADALAADAANEVADALLDRANGIETSLTLRGAIRLIAAVVVGKLSGAGTATEVFRNVGDSKDRVTATVDSSGNRSAVTADAT